MSDPLGIRIFYSAEDEGFIAVDELRHGCSAYGGDEIEALKELHDARQAWDEAKSQIEANRAER